MNGMLSAVMAQGQTILENCAKEPHVVCLLYTSTMLNAVAGVWPVASGKIIIDGTDAVSYTHLGSLSLNGNQAKERKRRSEPNCEPDGSSSNESWS